MAQKKWKAKASTFVPKKVRFSEPKTREAPSKPAPALTKDASKTTMVLSLPASPAPITQLPSPSTPTYTTSGGPPDPKLPLE